MQPRLHIRIEGGGVRQSIREGGRALQRETRAHPKGSDDVQKAFQRDETVRAPYLYHMLRRKPLLRIRYYCFFLNAKLSIA